MNMVGTSRTLAIAMGFQLLVAGCGDTPTPMDEDSGPGDGGAPVMSCDGEPDGTSCGDGNVCVAGACVASECGDGIVDTTGGEECDDGNDVAFDGCEPSTCLFTCNDDALCTDGNPCNGAGTCNESHVCEQGAAPAPGAACTTDTITEGVCHESERCVGLGCGDGTVGAGEECDDGNTEDGDGCQLDCTFTCTEDRGCDLAACQACDTTTHLCGAVAPSAWYADCDGDGYATAAAGTMSECVIPSAMPTGCPADTAQWVERAPLGPSSIDCNDEDAATYPGAPEECNGRDESCDGTVDEGTGQCRVDGRCIPDGTANGECRYCDVATTHLAWSNRPATTACDDGAVLTCGRCNASGLCVGETTCDDGVSCTTDSCEDSTSTCVNAPGAGQCAIDSACVPDGTTNGACQYCDSAANPTAWTNRPTTTTCDDGAAVSCGQCDTSGACAAATSCDDMISCTTDSCEDSTGTCSSVPVAGQCLIDGTCYADADVDMANSCQQCTSTTSATAWTARNGVRCNDGDSATCNDRCNLSANCAGTAAPRYYRDGDSDTYGGTTTMNVCSRPSGYVSRGGDCNDGDRDVFPGALELCDTVDDNCASGTRDGCPSRTETWSSTLSRSSIKGMSTPNPGGCGSDHDPVGPNTSSCGSTSGMRGITGRAGTTVVQLRAQCYAGTISESSASPEYDYDLNSSGGATYGTAYGSTTRGTAFTRTCPAGQWVVGIAGRAGCVPDQITMICAPIHYERSCPTCSGWVAVRGATSNLTAVGNPGGSAFTTYLCPTDSVATQIELWSWSSASPSLSAVRLGCRELGYNPQ